jgi:hypothetical protein
MKNQTQKPKLTIEGILASLDKTDRVLSKKFAKTDRDLKKQLAETDLDFKKQLAETDRDLKKQLAETDRDLKKQLAETDLYLKEKFAETDRIIKANSKDIGGISKSNGEIAEDYFINSFDANMHFAGQKYDSLASNLNKKIKSINLECEFDIVLYNCTSIGIIEVKYRAEKKHITSVLEKPQIFKQLFPEYANFNIYLGLAGLSMKKEVETAAKEEGIAVIKQVGEKMVIYDKNLRVF